MRFVYQKEFVAQRAERPADAVADLYRTRGLSTDTAVEAGYLVHLGLAVAKGLQPDRRIRRVLVIGPGLDLAPRTGLRNTPPESYQPWAVIDALLATGLARVGELEVTAADINPRVIDHLRRARSAPPRLQLATDIVEKDGLRFSGSTASTSRTSGPICRRRRWRSGRSRMKKGAASQVRGGQRRRSPGSFAPIPSTSSPSA